MRDEIQRKSMDVFSSEPVVELLLSKLANAFTLESVEASRSSFEYQVLSLFTLLSDRQGLTILHRLSKHVPFRLEPERLDLSPNQAQRGSKELFTIIEFVDLVQRANGFSRDV